MNERREVQRAGRIMIAAARAAQERQHKYVSAPRRGLYSIRRWVRTLRQAHFSTAVAMALHPRSGFTSPSCHSALPYFQPISSQSRL